MKAVVRLCSYIGNHEWILVNSIYLNIYLTLVNAREIEILKAKLHSCYNAPFASDVGLRNTGLLKIDVYDCNAYSWLVHSVRLATVVIVY